MNEQELRQFLQTQDAELKQIVTKGDRELAARMLAVEQTITAPGAGGIRSGNGGKSIGQIIIESDGFAALQKGAPRSGRLAVPELKVLSGTWSAAPDYRPVVAFPPQPGTEIGRASCRERVCYVV